MCLWMKSQKWNKRRLRMPSGHYTFISRISVCDLFCKVSTSTIQHIISLKMLDRSIRLTIRNIISVGLTLKNVILIILFFKKRIEKTSEKLRYMCSERQIFIRPEALFCGVPKYYKTIWRLKLLFSNYHAFMAQLQTQVSVLANAT